MVATGQTRPPATGETVLYARGLKQIEAGQLDKARLSLQTLINTYSLTPLRAQARAAIRTSWIRQGIADPDPLLLFLEGQTRATAGKREAALLAFQTLINLYPLSDYAEKARRAVSVLQPGRD